MALLLATTRATRGTVPAPRAARTFFPNRSAKLRPSRLLVLLPVPVLLLLLLLLLPPAAPWQPAYAERMASLSRQLVRWQDIHNEPGLRVYEDFDDLAVGADGYALPDIAGNMNMSLLNGGKSPWRHLTAYRPGQRRYSRKYRPAVLDLADGFVEAHRDHVMVFDSLRFFVPSDCGRALGGLRVTATSRREGAPMRVNWDPLEFQANRTARGEWRVCGVCVCVCVCAVCVCVRCVCVRCVRCLRCTRGVRCAVCGVCSVRCVWCAKRVARCACCCTVMFVLCALCVGVGV